MSSSWLSCRSDLFSLPFSVKTAIFCTLSHSSCALIPLTATQFDASSLPVSPTNRLFIIFRKVFLKIWHQETLNHELDKVIKKVITCQKVVRGFLCRRRLAHLLEAVQRQAQEQRHLLAHIHAHSAKAADKMTSLKLSPPAPTTTSSANTTTNSSSLANATLANTLANAALSTPPGLHSNAATSHYKSVEFVTDPAPSFVNPEYQNLPASTYQSAKKASDADYQNITSRNTKANSRPFSRQQGEKIATLKSQIERQMKAYVKQEEYDEMLKLIKVSVLPNPLPALPAY